MKTTEDEPRLPVEAIFVKEYRRMRISFLIATPKRRIIRKNILIPFAAQP